MALDLTPCHVISRGNRRGKLATRHDFKVMEALKISIISSFGFAIFFAIFSVFFYFGDWTRLWIVFFLGFFIGLVAAPEIEPKAFKMPWMLQLFSGLVAGLIAGLFFDLNPTYIVMVTLLGGLLGWLAPFWVKHIGVP